VSFDADETNETHERRITRCRSCRAQIIWLPTAKGKNMPCDAHSVQPDDDEFEQGRHVPHWSTCPNADQHRRSR
jgi:hypothetical protein